MQVCFILRLAVFHLHTYTVTKQRNPHLYFYHLAPLQYIVGSSGGVVVNLLACKARNPEFKPGSRHYDLIDWVSPASSHDMTDTCILIK